MSSFSDTSFFLFFLLSLSSLPQLSGPGRAGVGDVQSCAASRGRLPSSRHSALSLSLSLSLRGNRFVTLPKGPSLNQTRLLPPRGERERESWDGKGMRGGDSTGREARRRPQTKRGVRSAPRAAATELFLPLSSSGPLSPRFLRGGFLINV